MAAVAVVALVAAVVAAVVLGVVLGVLAESGFGDAAAAEVVTAAANPDAIELAGVSAAGLGTE